MIFQSSLQYDDAFTAAGAIYKEIVEEDEYGLRELLLGLKDPNCIRTIVDIGANIGFFSLSARVLFPNTRIIAIEPCADTVQILQENLRFFKAEIYQGALGNGEMFYLHKQANNPSINRFLPDTHSDESLKSFRLAEIFELLKVESPYILKIDCEGGERWIMDSAENHEILKNAAHLGIEAHLALFGEQGKDWQVKFEGLFSASHTLKSSSRWEGAVNNYNITQQKFLKNT